MLAGHTECVDQWLVQSPVRVRSLRLPFSFGGVEYAMFGSTLPEPKDLGKTADQTTRFPSTGTTICSLALRQFVYTFWILSASWPGIILIGIFVNVTNTVIFLRAGVKDNVTTLLLALSLSDLIFLCLLSPRVSSLIIWHYAPDWYWPFSITFIDSLFYWPAYTFYAFSSYISVWLGVTRCACVAMPLQFKSVFTKSRTVTAVLALFVLAVSLHVPMMSMFRIA
ncbi:chemosensory receptor c [Plakobranchus ocellatus]|uniref:Chemosensory receptor c n=1 Tax=Plakobranchus ocellatus TaxID=259542 RepID=A0AAV3ZPW7_9GAST|nr:chemosensory receptor c [Plakobranchus ocellatus]